MYDALVWATSDAPVADVQERAVLSVMAVAGDEDGEGSGLHVKTIAERAMLSEREVRNCQRAMMDRGLLELGDQSRVQYIRADRRPTVWNLLVPYAMFPNVNRINTNRVRVGREPITRETRPDIPPPPPRKRRVDAGRKRGKPHGVTAIHPVDGVNSSPAGIQGPDGVNTSASAPYIDPVVDPLLLAPAPTPPPLDRVVVDDLEQDPTHARAAGVLAAVQQSSGLPVGRMVRGEPLTQLVALLAARLEAGWTDQQATDALGGKFNGGPVFGALRYRINNNLSGRPPGHDLIPPPRRYVRPWCGRCAGAEARRYINLDTGAATADPCPVCAVNQPLASTPA